MTSKIFRSILFVAISVLIASLFIVTGVLYQYFGSIQESQLKDELKLVGKATEKIGESYLKELNSKKHRFTLVNFDGTVIFDTDVNAETMENHADRKEIKEALLLGTGSSIRYSSTLTKETVYEAIRLNNGNVLRISVSRATEVLLVFGMIQPILIILVISVALSAWLANRMAKRVVEPLNRLNLENPMENETYEELSPLLHRIYAQHQEIKYQMKTLSRKQDEFEQITSNMKEAMVLLDNTERIVSINPAAKKLFFINDDCIGEDFLSVDRKQDMRQAIQEAKDKGYSYFNSKKNGRNYKFNISLINSGGKNYGIVILAFDITEQINAEKNRREFTANVSHELKTPLQSIIGSAELMENGIVKDEDIPRFIGHIRKEASRLVYLIDDIIHLSKMDEGIEMTYEDVSLNVISKEVCETLMDVARQKDITLEVIGDNGVIKGVRRLLYEVVYNLCDNAIKYNNIGGYVKIFIKEQDELVKISVEDNGIGIDSKYHDKIFERFYRIDKSHSKQSGGTGLGLSIVKHAIQYHKGSIEVESELNKGTTISIVFNKNLS